MKVGKTLARCSNSHLFDPYTMRARCRVSIKVAKTMEINGYGPSCSRCWRIWKEESNKQAAPEVHELKVHKVKEPTPFSLAWLHKNKLTYRATTWRSAQVRKQTLAAMRTAYGGK